MDVFMDERKMGSAPDLIKNTEALRLASQLNVMHP
jgi:hypothetical protein